MNENKIQTNNQDIKVLRTYTSDMADMVKEKEMSAIKIALAEKEKKEKESSTIKIDPPNNMNLFYIIGGIILIIVAIVGSYFIFQKKKNQNPDPITAKVETFIVYESFSDIDTTEINDKASLVNIIKQQNNPGLVNSLFLKRKTGNEYSILTSNEFLTLIKATAPGTLTRSLSDKYLLGQYTNTTDNSNPHAMFLILETTDYNQAYSSMLDWEKTVAQDLIELFSLNILDPDNSSLGKSWRDIVVNNKDTRVLYEKNGKGILYYTFVNKNDLVITNNMETLKEIISRIIIKN